MCASFIFISCLFPPWCHRVWLHCAKTSCCLIRAEAYRFDPSASWTAIFSPLKIWGNKTDMCSQIHGDREVMFRYFMYCCMIPSIRQSLTAVYRLMTGCLRLPDEADCWECHQCRHLYTDEKTRTPQIVMWMHRFILSLISGMMICGKTCGQSDERRDGSRKPFTREQWRKNRRNRYRRSTDKY